MRTRKMVDGKGARRLVGASLWSGEVGMLERLNETIVAISSAPGHAPMGIVRLSGPAAVAIVDRMATTPDARPLAQRPGSTRVSGEVWLNEGLSLPASFHLFRAPHSYNRQDIVEICTVGSPAALEMVRRRVLSLGAIPAEPGEFTARAFLLGAIDLASAEAVAGVIRAQTDTQLRAARRMADEVLGERITATRDELAELASLVEADIDFAEEAIEFINPDALRLCLEAVGQRLYELLDQTVSTERFDVLPRILLFGPPNSGKSSLMNRLSGTRRAICAAAAGTTRDILSAPVRVGTIEAILLDTAGLDQSADEIIAQARAMTMSAAEQVDLVCVVFDLADTGAEGLLDTAKSLNVACVVAANKCDLVADSVTQDMCHLLELKKLGPVCPVSATKGTGIEELRTAFAELLGSAATTVGGESVLVNERQRTAIQDAAVAIGRASSLAKAATETIDCADLLAFELREALDTLGSVTGQVTTEDLLDQVFANFCIGK